MTLHSDPKTERLSPEDLLRFHLAKSSKLWNGANSSLACVAAAATD